MNFPFLRAVGRELISKYYERINMKNTELFLAITTIIVLFAGWLTHIIHCLMYAKYVLLIAGALVFPVGIIHGIGIWFGANW